MTPNLKHVQLILRDKKIEKDSKTTKQIKQWQSK